MARLRKRFVRLRAPLAVILLVTLLAAQEPPNPCANACWQTYLNAAVDCHSDGVCLTAARAEAEACLDNCHLTPPR